MKILQHDRFGPPADVLELIDSEPQPLAPNEVAITVEAASIHAGDLYNIEGEKIMVRNVEGGERVEAAFWTGHPRNTFHTGGNYLSVERKSGDKWQTIYTDADWETRCRWQQTDRLESVCSRRHAHHIRLLTAWRQLPVF